MLENRGKFLVRPLHSASVGIHNAHGFRVGWSYSGLMRKDPSRTHIVHWGARKPECKPGSVMNTPPLWMGPETERTTWPRIEVTSQAILKQVVQNVLPLNDTQRQRHQAYCSRLIQQQPNTWPPVEQQD